MEWGLKSGGRVVLLDGDIWGRGRLVVGVVGVCWLALAWLAEDASPGARLEVCGWAVGLSRCWELGLAGGGRFAGGEAWGVRGRLKPATMGAFKTSHFEVSKVCHKYSPIPTIAGFKEISNGESTQNGYGKRNIDIKTAWMVSSTYCPRAWDQP